MEGLKIWFLDVGHGDCAYLQLPNGARMMIDCGGGENHWPSKLLKYFKVTKADNPVQIPNRPDVEYGIDNLVVTHPHGDHIADIKAIHDDIGFFLLTGGYGEFIDALSVEDIDFRKNRKEASEKFKEVVKKYCGQYVASEDRVHLAEPVCVVKKQRFINYERGMDLNELSWFVSVEIANHKILFTGDMTCAGITKILNSPNAQAFKDFVRGTTILKIPHHARKNGCSQELFDAFGQKPLLGIASDESLNDSNENTSAVGWYASQISDEKININGIVEDRRVLTTRQDKDIFLWIPIAGGLAVRTHCFDKERIEILEQGRSGLAGAFYGR